VCDNLGAVDEVFRPLPPPSLGFLPQVVPLSLASVSPSTCLPVPAQIFMDSIFNYSCFVFYLVFLGVYRRFVIKILYPYIPSFGNIYNFFIRIFSHILVYFF